MRTGDVFPAKAFRLRTTRRQSPPSARELARQRGRATISLDLVDCESRATLAGASSLLKEVEAAQARTAGAVFYSPCLPSIPLSEITGMQIFCKLDNLQRTGSFKERGARNALAQLSADQKSAA